MDGDRVGVSDVALMQVGDGCGDGSGDGVPKLSGSADVNDKTRTRSYPHINGFEVRQTVDLRSIPVGNLEEIPGYLEGEISGRD